MVLFLKNLLFTLIVPGTVTIFVPLYIARDESPVWDPAMVLGGVLLVIGAAIYAWCVWDFASFGRGTPAPIDAPKRLVIRGLYRFTRNPMYLAAQSVILGWSVVFRSTSLLIYAAFVAALFNAFIRLYEEPHLEGEFGDAYTSYKARVGRWLPRPPRSPAG